MFIYTRCVAPQCILLQGTGLQMPNFHDTEVHFNFKSLNYSHNLSLKHKRCYEVEINLISMAR